MREEVGKKQAWEGNQGEEGGEMIAGKWKRREEKQEKVAVFGEAAEASSQDASLCRKHLLLLGLEAFFHMLSLDLVVLCGCHRSLFFLAFLFYSHL